MGKIIDQLKYGKILVSDGAWGTFLQTKGLQPGECPESWNISHPEEVLDIAMKYIKAGADLIETNSFGGSRFKLEKYGLGDKVHELNSAAAKISRKAAGRDKFVMGSIGPTGKILMMGDVSEDDLYSAFMEQSIALETGGADAIIIETMTDIDEATIAVRAAKENTKCEVFCTMTFDKTVTSEYRTMMGISPVDMVEKVISAGADLIGANCGNGTRDMVGIVQEIRKNNSVIPVLIHANAGMPIYKDGITVFPESPQEMAAYAKDLVKAGANIIGGCCGSTPAHIAEIVKSIKSAPL